MGDDEETKPSPTKKAKAATPRARASRTPAAGKGGKKVVKSEDGEDDEGEVKEGAGQGDSGVAFEKGKGMKVEGEDEEA